MDKCGRFLACMILGLAWLACSFIGHVDSTVRYPILNSLFSGGSGPGGGPGAESRYFPHPAPHRQPTSFRILPTIISIKNGRVRLNYGYNSKLRSRRPHPSSYSLSDWVPIPRKPSPPSLPTSYGPKNHRPPPPSGWAPPAKGWEPPAKGWAPKKKNVIYVLLKEPEVKTNVQVHEDGQKNEPEVILQYEGLGQNAQTHYEINKPTPQTQTLLDQELVLVPSPSPSPIPLPLPVTPTQPAPESGGYIIQTQNQQEQQQLVLEQPVAVNVNNAAHNILSGYSGYSLNSLNTNGLPISFVFKRMPEVQQPAAQAEPAAAAATNERVEVSVTSVTKQVSAS